MAVSLDLEQHLIFYGTYHRNPVNMAIHIIFVLPILFSAFILSSIGLCLDLCSADVSIVSANRQATNSGPLVPLPAWATPPYLDLNLGTIAATTWGLLYLLLEPVAGTLLAVIGLAVTALGNRSRLIDVLWANVTGQDPLLDNTTNRVALAVHVLGWILQFIGHVAFERRGPALADNVFESVFLAPLYIWLKFLFFLGYRQPLRQRVDEAVQREVAKLAAKKKSN